MSSFDCSEFNYSTKSGVVGTPSLFASSVTLSVLALAEKTEDNRFKLY